MPMGEFKYRKLQRRGEGSWVLCSFAPPPPPTARLLLPLLDWSHLSPLGGVLLKPSNVMNAEYSNTLLRLGVIDEMLLFLHPSGRRPTVASSLLDFFSRVARTGRIRGGEKGE